MAIFYLQRNYPALAYQPRHRAPRVPLRYRALNAGTRLRSRLRLFRSGITYDDVQILIRALDHATHGSGPRPNLRLAS